MWTDIDCAKQVSYVQVLPDHVEFKLKQLTPILSILKIWSATMGIGQNDLSMNSPLLLTSIFSPSSHFLSKVSALLEDQSGWRMISSPADILGYTQGHCGVSTLSSFQQHTLQTSVLVSLHNLNSNFTAFLINKFITLHKSGFNLYMNTCK